MNLKQWLLTSSIEDANCFTKIKKLARTFHIWRGHRWAETWATASVTIGEKICEIKFRRCMDCDVQEMMNEKGEWIGRNHIMKELWMDDIGTIANEATTLIENRLREHGIEIETPQEDEFYVPIFDALEKYTNGNYRRDD